MSARDAFTTLQQIGLEPLLLAVREKIYTQDGPRGQVQVHLERAAREELANLTGRSYGRAGLVRVELAELDAGLRNSRFRTDLVAVLAAGYGQLVTRRQEQQQAEARWSAWVQQVHHALPPAPAVADWLAGLSAGTSASGRWIRRAYRADPDGAAQVVLAVGSALAQLPGDQGSHQLLAVFAARLTGDPHTFDSNRAAGMLLCHALSERFGHPDPGLRPSEERALLLDRAGLGVDQVSSTVLVAHLAAATTAEGPHPVVASMLQAGGAWSVTLGEVRRWMGARATHNRAYVVENPAVFEYLLQRLDGRQMRHRPTLICTGGFLSAAAVRLLDLLAAGGAELWYGGDFDRNGLAIATWLATRYLAQWHPWRMGPDDYRMALAGAGKEVSPEDRAHLASCSGVLAETARAVAEGGAAYQERLVDLLVADV